jgi:hypothetical protein
MSKKEVPYPAERAPARQPGSSHWRCDYGHPKTPTTTRAPGPGIRHLLTSDPILLTQPRRAWFRYARQHPYQARQCHYWRHRYAPA